MRAMTCRGAMLVTLLLVATAASTHGARKSLAERFLADVIHKARTLDAGPTSDDVTASSVPMPTSPVLIDDEEEQTTNSPEQEMEEIVDQENPKVKTRPKPKNSLMQRTRDKMNRRRAQSRYGAENNPRTGNGPTRTGSGPTRARLTARPRITTPLPPRRRYTPRWRQRQRTTISTTTLQPITRSTEPQSRIPITQTTTSTTTLEPITTSTEPQSSIPTTQITTSTTTLEPITRSTEQKSSLLTTSSTTLSTTQMTTTTTEADSTYPTEISEAITLTTPRDSQSSTTPLASRIRFIPRMRRTTTVRPTTTSTTTIDPITTSTDPQSRIPTTQITTSSTTLEPITRSTEQESSLLTTSSTTLSTTQMTTTTTEADSTYPTESSETITLTTPRDSQSSTTPLAHRRRFIPRRRRTTTVRPTATSTTTLEPITTSTEPQSSILTTHNTTTTIQPATTSSTTLEPITRSTEQESSLLTTSSTTLSTTQMTTTTTEADSTYPTESSEAITLTTPRDSQSSTTPLAPRIKFIPRMRRTTTVRPTTTSTTTLQTIIKSTEPQSIIFTTNSSTLLTTEIITTTMEADSTYPTEIPEDITLTTPTDSPITFIKIAINTDDSLTTTTTTAKSTTTTAPFQTTEASSQEIQTTEEAGHAGEVFLVEEEDIPNLKIPKPFKKLIPKPIIVGSGLSVGVGLNVEDPEFGLERVGPVFIMGNSLRKRRQHHGEHNITAETDSFATDQPVETTINPFNDGFDENDFETTLGPISFNRRRTSTASPTTLNESPQNLSDTSDTTIEANSEAENNVVLETANGGSFPDFQEITVGTKVNLGGPEKTSVAGEVIPVELENRSELKVEHKSEDIVLNSENKGDQTTLVSDKPEKPDSSFLGSILNYFTQSKPDRPQILRPKRPEFRPFRPRPQPSNSRPDILPPRPSSRPNIPEINSDSTTNRPVDTTIFPEDSLGDELPSRSTSGPFRFPNFRPRPTELFNKPSRPSSLLPSKPIIESGFQGIPGENGESRPAGLFRPGAEELNDYEYDADALPPSLPNLIIIPFVASDALTHHQGGNIDSFTGDDFRISLQDKVVSTTAKPITTERSTRRPLPIGTRRPPILSARRPSPFRQRTPRPGARPSVLGARPSFLPSRTTPRDKITSEENRIAPSTTSPFILRFTTERSFTPFTLASVEKTADLVPSEPEKEITTDDLPSTESITVNTPSAPPRLPEPILTTSTPVEVNTPSAPPRLPEPVITTRTPVEVNTPEARPPLRLPGPIRPIITSSQSSSVSSSSSKPISTDDISGFILQDVFGNPDGTTRTPVQFIPASKKPVILKKTKNTLPAIPSLITNLFPLAPDPIVAQGLLKLSGCNIYGRMYNIDDRIKELSAECKECRCTPVGVQCLPVCA